VAEAYARGPPSGARCEMWSTGSPEVEVADARRFRPCKIRERCRHSIERQRRWPNRFCLVVVWAVTLPLSLRPVAV
jgi:hypothetical protein